MEFEESNVKIIKKFRNFIRQSLLKMLKNMIALVKTFLKNEGSTILTH